MSQSPQTGQVYFNNSEMRAITIEEAKSQSPQTGQVYFNAEGIIRSFGYFPVQSQSPQTGQVYFNLFGSASVLAEAISVTIPSNGSSLFQWNVSPRCEVKKKRESQSPQTGQVYFNRRKS